MGTLKLGDKDLVPLTVWSKDEETINVSPSIEPQTILPTDGKTISKVKVNAVDSSIDPNIRSDIIIEGNSILGVDGTAVIPNVIRLGATADVINPKVKYGVKIDLNDPDPETSVHYIDDSDGFSKSYMDFDNDEFVWGSWEDKFPFNKVRPCLFKDGKVVCYLDKNDYTKDLDGNEVDISSGDSGDVMIEIPKVYYRLYNDENYQYVEISNKYEDGFCCLAHTYKGKEKNRIYVGAYCLNSNFKSVNNSKPENLVPYLIREKVQAKGEGYEIEYWNLLILFQCLYVIQFKNLNAHETFGYPIDYSTSRDYITGVSNKKGLYYAKNQVVAKFMGIENFLYLNGIELFDGAYFRDGSLTILDVLNPEMKYSFRTSHECYTIKIETPPKGYIKKVIGTNTEGFVPSETSGSASTYYTGNFQYFSNIDGYISFSSFFTSRNLDDTASTTAQFRFVYCD